MDTLEERLDNLLDQYAAEYPAKYIARQLGAWFANTTWDSSQERDTYIKDALKEFEAGMQGARF